MKKFIFFLLFSLSLFAKEFVIGVEHLDLYPYAKISNGKYIGYVRELLDEFAKEKGYKFIYKPMHINRLTNALVEDKIDFKFPDNEYWASHIKKDKKIYYSLGAVDYIDGVMVKPKNLGRSLANLKKLGTIEGFTAFEYLDLIAEGRVKLSEIKDLSSLLRATLNEQVDGSYVNVAVAYQNLEESIKNKKALVFDYSLPHSKSSYKLSSTLHPKIVEEFNDFISQKSFFIQKLKERYALDLDSQIKKMELVDLNTNELNWIKKHPIISYSNTNWEPISIVEEAKLSGIHRDYMNLIAKKTGLHFEFKKIDSFPQILEEIKDKKLDLTATGKTHDRENYMLFSKPLTNFSLVIVTKDSVKFGKNIKELYDKRVVVPKGYTSHEYLKENFPDLKLTLVDNITEALTALSFSKADAVVGNLAVIGHQIKKLGLTNLKVAGTTDYEFNLHLAIRDDYKILHNILQKAIEAITIDEHTKIQDKWLSISYDREVDYATIFKILGLSLIIISIIAYWNIRLSKEITKRKIVEKELTETRNKIIDSIKFSSMIQDSILPNEYSIKHSFDDYFIIWEPKDIVGGDIYLFEEFHKRCSINTKYEFEGGILILVIDCVGHGVAGAFMTMIVKTLLKNIITENNYNNPAIILEELNREIRELLKQDKVETLSNAGLDGGVIFYKKDERRLIYAGAKTPLFYIQDGEFQILKGDRHSVGYKDSNPNFEFTNHEIKLNSDSYFYLTTDGLIDQIGGSKSLPFGKNRLKKILVNNYEDSFENQKESILKELKSYQRKEERLDDITMFGFRVK